MIYHSPAFSQSSEPGYLDLGRVEAKNQYTQGFTIKPEYLERMPFANLTEALAPWLYGNFSNSNTVVYVVDGQFAMDVNIYSIHEIAEIRLIQNAMVSVNGAHGQTQLVIIKTKRNKEGKSGVSGSTQTFLVSNADRTKNGAPHIPSSVNLFHQYDIAAYHNLKDIQFGASANFLRDVYPTPKADSIHTSIPENFHRFRLNGYLDARLGKHSLLFINMNYTPQAAAFKQTQYFHNGIYSPTSSIETDKQPEHLIVPSLRLESEFSKHWSNILKAGFDSYREHSTVNYYESFYNPSVNPPASSLTTLATDKSKADLLSLGDQIRYQAHFHQWELAGMLDFHYLYSKASDLQTGISNGGVYNYYQYEKGHIFLLTPSLLLTYKNELSLQAGFLQNLGHSTIHGLPSNYPFVSATADLLKLTGNNSSNELKIFGSYASSANIGEPSLPLSDFAYSSTLSNFSLGGPVAILGNGNIYISATPNLHTWVAEGGLAWISLHGRLLVNYLFERRAFNTEIVINYFNGYGFEYPLVRSNTQRLSVQAQIIKKADLQWTSTFTITNISINKGTPPYFTLEYATGDYKTTKPSFTGGWMNRVQYRNYLFGMDILYHFSQQFYSTGNLYLNPPSQRLNSLLLQNLYVGYHFKKWEIYMAARNLYQNKQSSLTNGNRYYGLGANIPVHSL